jgi:hypothetical protein
MALARYTHCNHEPGVRAWWQVIVAGGGPASALITVFGSLEDSNHGPDAQGHP